MIVFAWILLGLGTFIAALNFFLSFLRYPLHRLRGRSKDEFRWVSGFPFVGSAFVIVGWLLAPSGDLCTIVAGCAVLIDTGGPVWMLIMGVYGLFADRDESRE